MLFTLNKLEQIIYKHLLLILYGEKEDDTIRIF